MSAEKIVMSAVSILERKIRLTEQQWTHIILRHPELSGQTQKIRITLEEPDEVVYDELNDNFRYVKLFEKTPFSKKHLLVVVRHLDKEGFVITAFFMSRIRRRGKVVVWKGRKG